MKKEVVNIQLPEFKYLTKSIPQHMKYASIEEKDYNILRNAIFELITCLEKGSASNLSELISIIIDKLLMIIFAVNSVNTNKRIKKEIKSFCNLPTKEKKEKIDVIGNYSKLFYDNLDDLIEMDNTLVNDNQMSDNDKLDHASRIAIKINQVFEEFWEHDIDSDIIASNIKGVNVLSRKKKIKLGLCISILLFIIASSVVIINYKPKVSYISIRPNYWEYSEVDGQAKYVYTVSIDRETENLGLFDSIMRFKKPKKPEIVYLHGYYSSTEKIVVEEDLSKDTWNNAPHNHVSSKDYFVTFYIDLHDKEDYNSYPWPFTIDISPYDLTTKQIELSIPFNNYRNYSNEWEKLS